MIREAIEALVDGRDLTEAEAAACMDDIMSEQATPAQFGAFVIALRLKGETVDEIAGMARIMREKAVPVSVPGPLLDTCGTGGDGSRTFNASTAAAFVAAGAGARVAKHGNRAITSACGSADVLEALGGNIDLSGEAVAATIERAGFAFMFAQAFHPAMKFAGGLRREIGVRTARRAARPRPPPSRRQARARRPRRWRHGRGQRQRPDRNLRAEGRQGLAHHGGAQRLRPAAAPARCCRRRLGRGERRRAPPRP